MVKKPFMKNYMYMPFVRRCGDTFIINIDRSNKEMWLTVLMTSVVVLLVLALLQQQFKKRNWTLPSTHLSKLAKHFEDLWTKVGALLAQIGTLLVQLKDAIILYLEDLVPSVQEILFPIVSMLLSPLFIFKGYFVQIETFISDRWKKRKFKEDEKYGCWDIFLLLTAAISLLAVFTAILTYFIDPVGFYRMQLNLFGYVPTTVLYDYFLQTNWQLTTLNSNSSTESHPV